MKSFPSDINVSVISSSVYDIEADSSFNQVCLLACI